MENKFVCKPIGGIIFELFLFYIGLAGCIIYLIVGGELILGLIFLPLYLYFVFKSNKNMNYCILKEDGIEIKTLFGKIYNYNYDDISHVKYCRPYKDIRGFKFFNNKGKRMYFEFPTEDYYEIINIAEFLMDKGVKVTFDWDDSYTKSILKDKFKRH